MYQQKNINYYILFISILPLLFKWAISFYLFGFNINSITLFNLNDIQYFPIIYSISDFNISPSYIENIKTDNLIGFPLIVLLVHSLFYKIFNIYGLVILEFIFQIIFIFILYKFLEKIFNDKNKSFYFLILILIFLSGLGLIDYYTDGNFFYSNLFQILEQNFGTRFPRPLITGPIIFIFFILAFDFKKEILEIPKFTYLLYLSLLLGLLFNSFFYYFINFLIILLIIFFINVNKIKIFTKKFLYRLTFFTVSLFIFLLPFIFQLIYTEPDYSQRMGSLVIDLNEKIFVFKYFFFKLLNNTLSILLLTTSIIFFIMDLILKNKNKNKNLIFLFILSSILSFIVFLFFSPKIVSIYHFLDILKFSLILYLSLQVYDYFYELASKLKIYKNKFSFYLLILIFILTSFSFNYYSNLESKQFKEDIILVDKFLSKNKIIDTEYKIFTNDLYITNLWLQKNNSNLILSDGFINSLKNSDIEFNFINTFKVLGFDEKSFSEFLNLGESSIRNSFFLNLFVYLYQANSLYTFSEIENYSENVRNIIAKESPFRAQNQILPENEKKRFLNLFNNHSINYSLRPDYIVINKNNLHNEFKIYNSNYEIKLSTQNYEIYVLSN